MDPFGVLVFLLLGMLNGVVYAMLLFLLSSGLTVVFGMLGVLNIAHASFYMLGAYFAYSLVQWTGSFWAALLLAPVAVGGLGVLVERFLLRKAHQFGHSHELLLTFGLAYIILEIVKWIWGTGSHPMNAPVRLDESLPILGQVYPTYRLFICALGLCVLVALGLLLFRTRLGMIVRAAVSDFSMVDALGFNVRALFVGVFGVGAGLAGLAGVIAAPLLSVYPGMGSDMLVDTFIVVVVGGLGSLKGALIASFILGELQSFGVLIIPRLAMIFSFLLMTLVLIWRPMGLFGERV